MYGLCLVELGNLASPSFTPEWPRPPYPVAFPNALRSLVPIWIPLPPLVTPLVCRQSTTDRSNTRAYRNPHIFLSFSFCFSFSSRSFATRPKAFRNGLSRFCARFCSRGWRHPQPRRDLVRADIPCPLATPHHRIMLGILEREKKKGKFLMRKEQ